MGVCGVWCWYTFEKPKQQMCKDERIKSVEELEVNVPFQLEYGYMRHQVAQPLLTNPRDALLHDSRQNFKTVTWP